MLKYSKIIRKKSNTNLANYVDFAHCVGPWFRKGARFSSSLKLPRLV